MTPGVAATLACVVEVVSPKPGNIHPGNERPDLRVMDFLASAAAIGPVFERSAELPLGQLVYEAIRATRAVTSTNTNLGIVLLLAPLAKMGSSHLPAQRARLSEVLATTTREDAAWVYRAIRLAEPGGLGSVAEEDVGEEPTVTLGEAMALASNRDRVAHQYVSDFADVFEIVLPALVMRLQQGARLEDAVVAAALATLARVPDSLVGRKRGAEEAATCSQLAADALEAWPVGPTPIGPPIDSPAWQRLLAWYAADPRGRNPGTTADLLAAALFLHFRNNS